MIRKGLMSFLIIGLLFSFVGTVSAADVGEEVKGFLSGTIEFVREAGGGMLEELGFGAFGGGGVDAFAQFLLMVITIMLVYSTMGFLGLFDDKEWINWIISIAAGFLGFLYVDAGWIRTLAEQYKIMAIVLNIVLPWGIVMAFIWRIQLKAFEGEGKINPAVANVLAWFLGLSLIGYLLFKIISDPLFIGIIGAISWFAIGAVIVFLIFKRKIIGDVIKGASKKVINKAIGAASKLGMIKKSNKYAEIIEAYNNGIITKREVIRYLRAWEATPEERKKIWSQL